MRARASSGIRAEKWHMTWIRALLSNRFTLPSRSDVIAVARARANARGRAAHAARNGEGEGGEEEAGTVIAKPNRFAVSQRVTAAAARIRIVLLSSW